MFELTSTAAEHNKNVLAKYNFDLEAAIAANKFSPLTYGSEFRHLDQVQSIFHRHPLWERLKSLLRNGSIWPLNELDNKSRQLDLNDALKFGNHKGATQKADTLRKLITKDITNGFSIIVPLSCITKIPGALLAPMNVMNQNTINEQGQIIPKDRLTHDQSYKWPSSGTSVNSRVEFEKLQRCMFGGCLRRLINYAVAARRKYPNTRILASKIDYKSAYRRCHLHSSMAIQACTQLPEDDLAAISTRLTFGGAPCPYEWGVISESICDLANTLLLSDDWNPYELHAPDQDDVPPKQYLPDDIPFRIGRELIVNIPVDPRGKADCYIDDTVTLTVDIDGTDNATRGERATLLAIHSTARPLDEHEPIPRDKMVEKGKLIAEGGLTEIKTILGWTFNFRTMVVTLPSHKYIAWKSEISKMITTASTTPEKLEQTIGRLTHVGFILPWIYHFLSRLRTCLYRQKNRRIVKLNPLCVDDLKLMSETLDIGHNGIDINILAYRSPDRIYRSDSCPAGLGGYSDQGYAWRWQVPTELQFRASNNLLEYLASIISPWIDIIANRLHPSDCALSMTDSTTAEGWLRKTNFDEVGNDPIQASIRLESARHHARLYMNAGIKGYSQWFPGKHNNIADALSRDWHRNDDELTCILRSHFPLQLPTHFKIVQLPNEISSFLTSLLQRLPVNEQLREVHTTTNLEHGKDGPNTANLSAYETHTWTNWRDETEHYSSELLPWHSEEDDFRASIMTPWLKAQSEIPFQVWYRPSGRREDQIQQETTTMNLTSFYHDNTDLSETKTQKKNNKRPFPSSC